VKSQVQFIVSNYYSLQHVSVHLAIIREVLLKAGQMVEVWGPCNICDPLSEIGDCQERKEVSRFFQPSATAFSFVHSSNII
jgi:hypothetical protein